MRRIFSLLGALGLGALSTSACSDDADVVFLQLQGGSGGSAGTSTGAGGGSSGRGGSIPGGSGGSAPGTGAAAGIGGAAGTGGPAVTFDAGARVDAGPVFVDAGDAGVLIRCDSPSDCDDENACTSKSCINDYCVVTPVPIGVACGDAVTNDECTVPDTCDGNGVCLSNDQPDGTLCANGHCNLTGVCDCAVDRVTALPYGEQWQTTADTEVDYFDECQLCDNTVDHVVVFTAAAAGTYRFTATSGGDVELAVFEGDCAGTPTNALCGEDIDEENEDYNDRLDLAIAAGATVTVVIGESCEGQGGNGNLTIQLLPEG